MGRILSSRRGQFIVDPSSVGAGVRWWRRSIMLDIGRCADDMETILRLSGDDRLKGHVRAQIARLAALAGKDEDPCPGHDGGMGGVSGGPCVEDDDDISDDELEREMWAKVYPG